MACIAVYRKPEFLIYSNLNSIKKTNVDHMLTMVLKHLLQVVLGLLVVKSLGPCCLFLKRVNPALPEGISLTLLGLPVYKKGSRL
jgi:hypothetical protein